MSSSRHPDRATAGDASSPTKVARRTDKPDHSTRRSCIRNSDRPDSGFERANWRRKENFPGREEDFFERKVPDFALAMFRGSVAALELRVQGK